MIDFQCIVAGIKCNPVEIKNRLERTLKKGLFIYFFHFLLFLSDGKIKCGKKLKGKVGRNTK